MKKVLCFILVLLASFSFVGCKKKENKKETKKQEEYKFQKYQEQQFNKLELLGDYQDKVSKRATATIIENKENNGVLITIKWSDSAFESKTWILTAKYYDDKLEYSDCRYFETQNDNRDLIYENGEGYFSVDKNNNISWDGAQEKRCRKCIFVKVKEDEQKTNAD